MGKKLKHNSPYLQVRLKRLKTQGKRKRGINVHRKIKGYWRVVAHYKTENGAVDKLVRIAEGIRLIRGRKED